jgi:hypothetical protein
VLVVSVPVRRRALRSWIEAKPHLVIASLLSVGRHLVRGGYLAHRLHLEALEGFKLAGLLGGNLSIGSGSTAHGQAHPQVNYTVKLSFLLQQLFEAQIDPLHQLHVF